MQKVDWMANAWGHVRSETGIGATMLFDDFDLAPDLTLTVGAKATPIAGSGKGAPCQRIAGPSARAPARRSNKVRYACNAAPQTRRSARLRCSPGAASPSARR